MIEAKTLTQALGDVLFTGNRVYRLVEPDRVLWVRKIHWDRETSDLEDSDGKVLYEVPWDALEFWEPVDYYLPDDDEPN